VAGLNCAEDDEKSDVDFDYDVLHVIGKGGRCRAPQELPVRSTPRATGQAFSRPLSDACNHG
jgi:hypothetical protein